MNKRCWNCGTDIEVPEPLDRPALVAELLRLSKQYQAAGYFRAWVTLTDVAEMLADPDYFIPSTRNSESRPT